MMTTLSNLINSLNPKAPKGLITSARAWVAQRQVYAPQMRNPQPRAFSKLIFAQEENIHLMEGMWEQTEFDEFQNVRWAVTEESWLYYLEECRILGDEGAVISPDNRVFCEFTFPPSSRWDEHSCFKRRRIPSVVRLPGWYATLVYPESKYFFHWMLESLPRMALLKDYLALLDGIFVPGPLQKFHEESLQALGVGKDKLIPVSVNTHYQPERLFVPRAFSMYNPPRWMHLWFKENFLADAEWRKIAHGKGRKVYISREDAPARRVLNEQEVVACLARHGFEVVNSTELSFQDQARLFNNADVIVAGHGAGLSNIVFCAQGTKIIEILPPRWMAPCFMVLASSAGCIYKHIVGVESVSGKDRDPQRDHIKVPMAQLEQLLQDMV